MTRFIVAPTVVGIIIALFVIQYFFSTPSTLSITPIILAETSDTGNRFTSFGTPASYADAVAKAQPAVVNIYTTKIITRRYHPFYDDPAIRRFFGMNSAPKRQRMQSSLGSGVIISTSGYIVTNNHVIEGADEIIVSLNDGRQAMASVIGTDPETDLAVLYIDAPDLPSITLVQGHQIRVGDIALAIGNPFGVGQTVTQGIVSALGRTQSGISSFVDFIQTDAAINPGNSGGALINAYGELIGINTAIYSKSGGSQGIGFAIPIDLAKQVLKELVEHGSVTRGWLGIEPQVLNERLAKAFNLPYISGLLVSGIFKNSPAHQAGIQPGDIITQINGKAIENPKATMLMISNMRPDEKVVIGIVRHGKELDVTATVSTRPESLQ